jgi:hypothetical protein
MPTASYLIADIQTKLGDPSGNIYTSANLLNWLDQAQKEFCLKTLVLRTIDATYVTTGLMRIPLPTDCIMVEALETARGGIPRKLKRITPTDFFNQQTAVQGVLATDPVLWTEMDSNIYVYPRYNGLSQATVLASSMTLGQTTADVGTAANFRSRGLIRLLIGSEEVEAQLASSGSTAGTATFSGLTRGLAQTTAAAHATGATVTQLDLAIVYRRSPQPLATVTATPEIRQIYHEKLELYCMYLAFMQTGEMEKAGGMYELWMDSMKEALYSAGREFLGPMSNRDMNTQQITGLYGPA